jgi:hypothetical protein
MSRNITFSWDDGEWKVGNYPAEDHVTEFKNTEPEQVVLQLTDDAEQAGYKFDTSDPIWIHAGESCPSKPQVCRGIAAEYCNNSVLVVRNDNAQKGRLRYQLNLLDRSNRKCAIDPIWDNGGNGRYND